jgi:hypothetical protein
MQRFAAKQLDDSGQPLFYLVEYEVEGHQSLFIYKGRALVTNDVNKQLTDEDEAFRFSFERDSGGWEVVNKINVQSKLGDDVAGQIRDSFFNDLILSGIMSFEQKKN